MIAPAICRHPLRGLLTALLLAVVALLVSPLTAQWGASASYSAAVVTQKVVLARATPLTREEFEAATRAYCVVLTSVLCEKVEVLMTTQSDTKPNKPNSAPGHMELLSESGSSNDDVNMVAALSTSGPRVADLMRSRWVPARSGLGSLFRTAAADAAANAANNEMQSLPLANTAMSFGKFITIDFAIFPPDGPTPWQLATRIQDMQQPVNLAIAQLFNVPEVTYVGTPTVAVFSDTCSNGRLDNSESDVDCGGSNSGCPRCLGGKKCVIDRDCRSLTCVASTQTCAAPAFVEALGSSAAIANHGLAAIAASALVGLFLFVSL